MFMVKITPYQRFQHVLTIWEFSVWAFTRAQLITPLLTMLMCTRIKRLKFLKPHCSGQTSQQVTKLQLIGVPSALKKKSKCIPNVYSRKIETYPSVLNHHQVFFESWEMRTPPINAPGPASPPVVACAWATVESPSKSRCRRCKISIVLRTNGF